VLAAGRAEGRAALIGYLPAGFPTSTARSRPCGHGRGRRDIVEVGVPYSDPQMDGPVIQQAVRSPSTGGP
jgi:tryptophan synthase alpha chain